MDRACAALYVEDYAPMRYPRVLALFMLLTLPASTLVAAPRQSRTTPSRIMQFFKRVAVIIEARITVPIGSPSTDPPPPAPTSDTPLRETAEIQ